MGVTMRRWACWALLFSTLVLAPALPAGRAQTRPLVLDNIRLMDGTGAPPVERARLVIAGGVVTHAGPASDIVLPADAERIDLTGRTVTPGLIDLHFHIERDPKLALRQLSHGVTAFRDPGQWEEMFEELRRMMAADDLPGPRIFTAGPHLDGERPAYPADSVVVRDPEEARRRAERNIDAGATALKLYFRLPLASARAAIAVCRARGVPCTSHNEIVDPRDLLEAGLHGFEHITSLGIGLLPRIEAERYRQAVLLDNNARRDGRYAAFAKADLDGPEANALYAALRTHRPWLDPTLAVFERQAGALPTNTPAEMRTVLVDGFRKMQQLTRRAASEGARVVMGGHTDVPFAGRGEAPWRELELLVDSGFTPLEALTAATGTAAAFLYRADTFGTLTPGRQADIVVFGGDPTRDISAVRTVERVMVSGRWVDVARYRAY
jgi:imidazolonepropionase-like amidohydrolase